jgi:hypothetical protein
MISRLMAYFGRTLRLTLCIFGNLPIFSVADEVDSARRPD